MRHLTTIVLLATAICSISAARQPAFAIEANISGQLEGRLSLSRYGSYAWGVGELQYLGKTYLSADLTYNEFLSEYIEYIPEYVFQVHSIPLSTPSGDVINTIVSPTRYDAETGSLYWEIEFIGGTGRFVEATGHATLVFQLPAGWGYGEADLLGEFELIDATLNH